MPSSHLPRTACDKFVYDFPCDFLAIVGGYRLRHMCSHCLRASCNFFYGAPGATRGKSVQRLCGDCTEIMQCQCSCRPVSAASARKSYVARAGIGLRTVPVRGLCNATYITTKISQPPPASAGKSRGGYTERGIWAAYGLRRPIASQMWTRHELYKLS